MISVIIPNWNGRDYLRECLDALRAQERVEMEIIVVDNASTDGAADMVAERFPSVRLLRLEENRGFAVAVNAGVRAAGGDVIALLNNDAVPHRLWLHLLSDALNRRPEFAFAASKVLFYDRRDVIDTAGDSCTPWGHVVGRGHGMKDVPPFDREEEVFAACACAAVYPRALFDDVGPFDENFFAYYEDVDWSFRARLRGHRCLYVPGAVVYHRHSASTSGASSKLGSEEVYLHLTGVLVKNMPGALILRHLPRVLLFHSAIVFFWLVARLRGRRRLPKVPFVRFMAAMLRERRRIQANRKIANRDLERLFKNENTTWRKST